MNWSGDLVKAEIMITKAKDCGANAVKFQAFYKEQIKHLRKSLGTRFNTLVESSFLNRWPVKLRDFARKEGIDLIVTPMSLNALWELRKLGIKNLKIRNKDWEEAFYPPRVDVSKEIPEEQKEALERSRLRMKMVRKIVDNADRIYISVKNLPADNDFLWNPKIRWLQATPKYPFPLEEYVPPMGTGFHGISDHCTGHLASLTACALAFNGGAEEFTVEKHFTLDHGLKDIDDAVSLDPEEFRAMVYDLRKLERMAWREPF